MATDKTAGIQIASIIADTVRAYLPRVLQQKDTQTIVALEIIGALKRSGFRIVEDQPHAE